MNTTVASGANYTSTSTKTSIFGVLRSELTKLRTVRSTYWSFLVTLVLVAGLSILIASAVVSRWDQRPPRERIGFDPTALGLAGVFLGQLAIGVLGVLVITSEYSTGSIRVSLAAVPQRLRMLFAKVGVFSLVTVVVGVVSCFAAFLGSQALFATKNAAAHLGDPGVTRAVLGAARYLTLVASCGARRQRSAFSWDCFWLFRYSSGSCRSPGRPRSPVICLVRPGNPCSRSSTLPMRCRRARACWSC
jgi:ABC-2 type transport system permease protein